MYRIGCLCSSPRAVRLDDAGPKRGSSDLGGWSERASGGRTCGLQVNTVLYSRAVSTGGSTSTFTESCFRALGARVLSHVDAGPAAVLSL